MPAIGLRKSPPSRIVCLTEETVETLYLLGEQDRIVGVTGYAVRPPQVRREKPRVSAFISADIPKILKPEPDLVLAFSDLQADIVAHGDGFYPELRSLRDSGGDPRGGSDRAEPPSRLGATARRAAPRLSLEALDVPVIAAVNGLATAAGLELALACDLIVATDDALLGDGHTGSGLIPGGGSTVRLPRTVGVQFKASF